MNRVIAIAALGLAAVSVWLVWPMLTLSTYPHIPDRAWLGMLLMGISNSLVRKVKP